MRLVKIGDFGEYTAMHPEIKQALQMQRSGDPWADTISPLFGVAEAIYVLDFDVPAALRFRAAPGLTLARVRANADDHDFANEMLDLIDLNLISVGELQHTALVLNRMADILKAQGKDY